jgi:CRISPR-associated protein Cmr4
MVMTHALLFLYAETPVHAGGPESIGAIDLPIQRSKHNGLPVIWGQSVKGALKDEARTAGLFGTPADLAAVMGSDPNQSPTADGWLAVNDARLVAFPVPTLENTFAWVTSLTVLQGVARYAERAGLTKIPAVPKFGPSYVACSLASEWSGNQVCVGAYMCQKIATQDALAKEWAEWIVNNAMPGNDAFEYFRIKLGNHLLVVDDDTFRAITEEFAELVPRIQLKTPEADNAASKTVEQLFYEENLPSETILVTLLTSMKAGQTGTTAANLFHNRAFTIGGSETVGRGLVWAHTPGGANP